MTEYQVDLERRAFAFHIETNYRKRHSILDPIAFEQIYGNSCAAPLMFVAWCWQSSTYIRQKGFVNSRNPIVCA